MAKKIPVDRLSAEIEKILTEYGNEVQENVDDAARSVTKAGVKAVRANSKDSFDGTGRYAKGNDLYTMGHYKFYSGIRQIVLYKGSFDRVYPNADAAETKRLLRGILRHEIRHHLEYLGGIHNGESLEAEDERKKQAYIAKHNQTSD